MSTNGQQSLLPWTLSFLRPYRKRVALLAVLLLSEIGLGALQPWPLKIVIDYALGTTPLPAQIQPWITQVTHGSRFTLLVAVVIAGVVLQLVNQLVSAYGTQVQVDAGLERGHWRLLPVRPHPLEADDQHEERCTDDEPAPRHRPSVVRDRCQIAK